MATLTSLTARFSGAPRLYLQTLDGVHEPTGGRGRRYWVVSRALCRFFVVPLLPDAAANKQQEALALEIERLSPFGETGSHIDLADDFASIWLWDQGAVAAAAEAIDVDVNRMRILPETALQPTMTEGVRLVETLDGVEGQSWIRGALAAGRWWPTLPDDRAWMLFQRGASVAPEHLAAAAPPATRLAWVDRPWTRGIAGGVFGVQRVDLPLVAACGAALLLIGYGYLGGEWLRLERDIHATRVAIGQHAKVADPILQARAATLDNVAAIKNLYDLDHLPSQLAVMARIADILPKNGTHFTDWTYDRGQLVVTVAADHPLDALFFVRALERIENFKNVAAERAGADNSLRIRLAIDRK